jgi:tRNA A37 threonylcarbamoyladenosine modification protein TsaB
VLDAKRGEFYAAVYRRVEPPGPPNRTDLPGGGYVIPAPQGCIWHKVLPDCLITASQLIEDFGSRGPLGVLGDGLLYHRDAFLASNVQVLDEACWSPRAINVYRLGHQKAQAGLFADPLTLTPFYLRAPHVTVKKSGMR